MASGDNVRFRTDIQALRGVAILLVLLYHARLPFAPAAGYLGVDVFFVVSGYLITGIISRGLTRGNFSFQAFYFRRAKRLLPAAYLTFVGTALAATLFLTQSEFHDFVIQLIGAVTFTGNVVLWRQTGYFEGAAELKPLLHVWSLSIEEQYYLVLPATLALVTAQYWRAGAWAVVVLSLGLCLVYGRIDPSATFYLLPTRAWELGIGSLGVLALEGRPGAQWIQRLYWPALAALFVVPFFPLGGAHPGPDAIIVCLATLVVILRNHPVVGSSAPMRGLSWFGDMSYSLYLVHWPLFALAASAWVVDVPLPVRIGLAIASVAIAWVMYNRVENPVRHADLPMNLRSAAVAVVCSLAVMAIGVGLGAWQARGSVDYQEVRRPNVGFDASCEYLDRFESRPKCRNSDRPEILVWGDSHAMHLVDAVASTTQRGVEQATKSACGPYLRLSYWSNEGSHNRNWAAGCIRFNQSVLDYITATPSIRVVVLASVSDQYLRGNHVVVAGADGSLADAEGSEEVAARALGDTAAAVRALGRRVVFVSSMPMAGYDVGRCLEQRALGKFAFGADRPDCAIDERHFREFRHDVLAMQARVERQAALPIVHLDDFNCHDGTCDAQMGGTFLYRDKAHLTHDGSRRLGEAMGLGRRVWDEAR